ncbi:MAG: hypothetical protein QOF14_4440 [Hyphomicrobiales bacterium]|jgi:3-hydroxyisobutyrate dehydrogenase-like beta-hydroxyacid dehydrogenase|nr:hypothetical protein [Hyphomicrobiales bacterium]
MSESQAKSGGLQVGFIGLGTMGRPMAENLLAKGHELTVFDRNQSALDAFAGKARIGRSVAECAQCEAIMIMVAFDDEVRDVVREIVAASNVHTGQVIAVMSTVQPETLTGLLAACRAKGIGLIDAPVMGMPARAEAGTLIVLAGGEAADVDKLRPSFQAFSQRVAHTGPLTTGQVTKLVNNMIAVSNLFMICEALNIGRAYGLDVPFLIALMDDGGGRSFFTKDWKQSKHNFSLFCESSDSIKTIVDICHKDIKHAATLAALMKIDAPFLRGVDATMDALSYDAVLPNWRSIL